MQNFNLEFKSNSTEKNNLKIEVEQVWRQAERKKRWVTAHNKNGEICAETGVLCIFINVKP